MTDEVRARLIKFIQARVPDTELMAQLAEEAAELAHAALKLRRAIDGTNPTPATVEEARAAMIEEAADVLLLVMPSPEEQKQVLEQIREIQDVKLRRWADRLREKEERHEMV